MNANEIAELATATVKGSMPFPEIVGKLIANGVEYYHVDYALRPFSFYSATGAVVTAPLLLEGAAEPHLAVHGGDGGELSPDHRLQHHARAGGLRPGRCPAPAGHR